uniref:SWI/SNF-related matrix-associated actin-dependent regulator of chromatin subfamily B member 1 n=1 Tax=Rhabditophanes sp. KR3021 TaxID=114890 RepID=A0AC35TJA3_9BILA
MTSMSHYGNKPKSFTLGDGNTYFIGSEVGAYLKLHRGTLYKKYPALWKLLATSEQRKEIQNLGWGPTYLCSNIMLVRQSDVEDIFAGKDEKFRTASQRATPIRKETSVVPKSIVRNTSSTWVSNQSATGSQHLEALPCTHPPALAKGHVKVRDYLHTADDSEHYKRVLENAGKDADLVPIRLDMEIENIKLRDAFVYNRNDKLITPEMIAEVMCDDLDLPANSFLTAIAQNIHQQIQAHVGGFPTNIEDDQRAILKLNIHVGNQSLVDQFEWDMSDPNNDPEWFAEKLCADLGLGGEFLSAIAYSIRGQLAYNAKTYAFSEAPMPKVDCPYRTTDADQWGPFLETLTEVEIEKRMRDQDRNTRRMRRVAQTHY